MARRERKSTKEFKNQNYEMKGHVVNCDSFGKNGEHAWFTLEDSLTTTRYLFKKFNCDDVTWDLLCNGDKNEVTVLFNIGYGTDKNKSIKIQLIATSIK